MDTDQAAENLQTIRTLMERSALYRRALAPIMIFTGCAGFIGMGCGLYFHTTNAPTFFPAWMSVAFLVIVGAFIIVRRQAIRDREPIFSPPVRRIFFAMAPALVTGALLGFLSWMAFGTADTALLWAIFYGLGLHSAGFVLPRSLKFLGLLFVIFAIFLGFMETTDSILDANWIMGLLFGGLHLIYGIYLYFTEKRTSTA